MLTIEPPAGISGASAWMPSSGPSDVDVQDARRSRRRSTSPSRARQVMPAQLTRPCTVAVRRELVGEPAQPSRVGDVERRDAGRRRRRSSADHRRRPRRRGGRRRPRRCPRPAPVTTTARPASELTGALRRRAARRRAAGPGGSGRRRPAGDDAVGEGADALDGQRDHVAGLQRRRVLRAAAAPQLGEAAAVAAGAGAEHVAGDDAGVRGRRRRSSSSNVQPMLDSRSRPTSTPLTVRGAATGRGSRRRRGTARARRR